MVKTLTETVDPFYAYLAGFIDGEGYFAIVRQKSSRYRKGFSEWILLDITSSCIEAIRTIQDFLKAGKVYSQSYENGWKTVYHLKLYTRTLRKILPLIYPFLIVKKEKVEEIQNWLQNH